MFNLDFLETWGPLKNVFSVTHLNTHASLPHEWRQWLKQRQMNKLHPLMSKDWTLSSTLVTEQSDRFWAGHTEMKLISIFSSDSGQDNKQQHFPKCQCAPLIRHLYPIGIQKRVVNSSGVLMLIMMYSQTPSPGHDGCERSAWCEIEPLWQPSAAENTWSS